MKYCICGIESFTYHTQKFNVLRPDLEAKVKAVHRRGQGQGQGSSRPKPGVFEAKAKATKFCPRAVLEVEASPRGPHPWMSQIIFSILAVKNVFQGCQMIVK